MTLTEKQLKEARSQIGKDIQKRFKERVGEEAYVKSKVANLKKGEKQLKAWHDKVRKAK